MDKPLLLVAVFLSLFVVLIAVFLGSRARSGRVAAHKTRPRRDGDAFVLMAGSDGGGSRKGSPGGDDRDAGGHDGGDGGGGDGGGGGGD